jgi:hypothetical protein
MQYRPSVKTSDTTPGQPLAAIAKSDPTPRRPRTGTAPKSDSNQQESDLASERDAFVETAELRRQMSGDSGREPEVDLPWLNELDQVVRDLNNNVLAMACVDTSPCLVFDLAASKVIENIDGSESIGDIGKQMVQDGFDAVKRMMDEEANLLNEQFGLLRTIQDTLIEHRCDYRADLEPDDFDLELSSATDVRPRTVSSGVRM